MRLYFRVKGNGAAIYRLDGENRHGRLDLQHVANVSVRSGEIRPQGGAQLGDEERAEIAAWVAMRRQALARRERRSAERLAEKMNEVAQWMQGRASDEEVEAAADHLLLAMHDLRMVIVQRKASLVAAS